MCQMAVPKFVTFCAIVPPAPRGRLRPLSIQLSNWIWKFSLGKRHPPKYMSNRKEILFKGQEILLTDMTKFSLPVDVSALTHRPAVGRNANTLKKKTMKMRYKEQHFLQFGYIQKRHILLFQCIFTIPPIIFAKLWNIPQLVHCYFRKKGFTRHCINLVYFFFACSVFFCSPYFCRDCVGGKSLVLSAGLPASDHDDDVRMWWLYFIVCMI